MLPTGILLASVGGCALALAWVSQLPLPKTTEKPQKKSKRLRKRAKQATGKPASPTMWIIGGVLTLVGVGLIVASFF